eukprot:2881740-Pleurochrysis_carterae.AAC.2
MCIRDRSRTASPLHADAPTGSRKTAAGNSAAAAPPIPPSIASSSYRRTHAVPRGRRGAKGESAARRASDSYVPGG